MADVSFSVDVILNMISKNMDKQFSSATSNIKKITNNTKSLNTELSKIGNSNSLKQLFGEGQIDSANSVSAAIGKAATKYKDFAKAPTPEIFKGKTLDTVDLIGKAVKNTITGFDTQIKKLQSSGNSLSTNAILGNKGLGSESAKIIDQQLNSQQELAKSTRAYYTNLEKQQQAELKRLQFMTKAKEDFALASAKTDKLISESSGGTGNSESSDVIPKQIADLQLYGNTLNDIEKFYGKNSKEADKYFKSVTKQTGLTRKELEKAQKVTKQFSFDFLSLIFGGQALSRIFGGAFKTLKEEYFKLTDDTDEFTKKTNKLSAAFTFLKFSLFDAFANSPVVQGAIEGLVKAFDFLANFAQENPAIASWFVGVLGALGIIGTGITIAGTWAQLFMTNGGTFAVMTGKIKDFSKIDGTKFKNNADNVKTGVDKLSKLKNVSLVVGIALAGAAVTQGVGIFKDINTGWNERIKNVLTSTFAGAAIGFKYGPQGAIIGAAIGLGISVVANVADFAIERRKSAQRQESIAEFVNQDVETFNEVYNKEFNNALSKSYSDYDGLGDYLTSSFKLSDKNIKKQVTANVEELLQPFAEGVVALRNEADNLDKSSKDYYETYTNLQKELNKRYKEGFSEYGDQFTYAVDAIDILNEKTTSLNNTGNIFPELSSGNVIYGIEALKDLDVENFTSSLESIREPLSEFLASFTSQEGLINSISNLITQTELYGTQSVPILTTALSDEKTSVDNLTSSYKKLADAKDKAGQSNLRNNYINGSGQSTLTTLG